MPSTGKHENQLRLELEKQAASRPSSTVRGQVLLRLATSLSVLRRSGDDLANA